MAVIPPDTRQALRAAFRDRRAALVVVLTLALAIGAAVAIFTLLDAVVLRPLPFRDPAALMLIRQTRPDNGAPFAVTAQDYVTWRAESTALISLGAIRVVRVNLGGPSAPAWVTGARVSASFFHALAMPPLLGRVFTKEEDSPSGARVTVISEGLWRRWFGAARLERLRLTIDGTEHTVVGVMPDRFRFPPQCELWTPLALDAAREEAGNHTLAVLGRLAPGRTLEQARAELSAIAERMAERDPDISRGWGVTIAPLAELLAREPRPVLLLLLGASLCTLLIACVNVGLLLLARAVARRHEVAVLFALGASRARIFWQFVLEAELLALAASAGALLVVLWLSDVLLGSIPPALLVRGDLRVGGTVLAFATTVALAAGFTLGVPAAFAAIRVSGADVMRGQPGIARSRGERLGQSLLSAELTLAVVLLVGVGLMLRTFNRLAATDPGFDPTGVVAAEVAPAGAVPPGESARRQIYADLVARVEALGDMSAAGAISSLPLAGASNAHVIAIEGLPERQRAALHVVTAGYFRAMGIPVTRGRLFAADETTTVPGPGVALVNETMARRFWPGEDPIGRHLALFADESTPRPWLTVVGVVGDVRHRGLGVEAEPEFYLPHAELPVPAMFVVARGSGDAASLARALRELVRAAPGLAVRDLRPMDAFVSGSVTPQRTRAALALALALLGSTLATIGLWGLTAWAVARRRHEFGVRLALGADPRRLLGMVFAWTLRLVVVGTVLGFCSAVVVWGLLARSLTAIGPVDPIVLAAVAVLMGALVVAAGYVPARRAARIDPAATLRHE